MLIRAIRNYKRNRKIKQLKKKIEDIESILESYIKYGSKPGYVRIYHEWRYNPIFEGVLQQCKTKEEGLLFSEILLEKLKNELEEF